MTIRTLDDTKWSEKPDYIPTVQEQEQIEARRRQLYPEQDEWYCMYVLYRCSYYTNRYFLRMPIRTPYHEPQRGGYVLHLKNSNREL